jgi:hypothetical protein
MSLDKVPTFVLYQNHSKGIHFLRNGVSTQSVIDKTLILHFLSFYEKDNLLSLQLRKPLTLSPLKIN